MSHAMRVLFDTEEYVTTLKNGGVPENQAHAMSIGLSRAFSQGVATSEDIINLGARIDMTNAKIDGVEKNLDTKIETVEKNLQTELAAQGSSIRTELTAKIEDVRTTMTAELKIQKTWLIIIAGLVALTNPVIMHLYKAIGLIH